MPDAGRDQKVGFIRNISTFSLTMTGITAIIGSGWLVGVQKIASIAGPASLIAWVIGAFVALLVGLFYTEIGSCFPSSGGIGYYAHRTHGRFCGFLTSWINWLSIVAVPPIEAQAIIQYLSQLTPSMERLYNVDTHALNSLGILFGIGLMLAFMFINYWSVQLFIRFNNVFTIIKIVVPLLTIAALFSVGIHGSNFGDSIQTFMPYGWQSILVSVVTSGVVMSFNGFQSPMTFSEEIRSPKKMLPIAVLGSILFCFIVYFFLQTVFIGSVDPALLANGWASVNYRSPFVDLLMIANLQIMVTVLYTNSVISPGVSGTAFLASGSRILRSLSKEGHLPSFLSQLHPAFHSPRYAIVTCTVIGSIFLCLFEGWYELVGVISVYHLLSYVPASIIVISNRLKNKELLAEKNQFHFHGAALFGPVLLYILSLLLFYAGWPFTAQVLILVIPGLCFYFYSEARIHKWKNFSRMLKGASWLLFYYIGLVTISYLGNHTSTPDQNILPASVSLSLLAALSLAVYIYGAYFAYTKHDA